MKKFNQMTEKQMSKVNGGVVGVVIAGVAMVAGSLGVFGGINHAVNNK